MKVIVGDYGVSAGVKDGMMYIKRGGEMRTVALGNISQIIVVTGGVSISSSLLRLLAKNNIDLVVFDSSGLPAGRFEPLMKKANVRVRKEQYKAQEDGRGLHLAKCFAKGKIMNQYYLLKSIAKNRKRKDVLEMAREIKYRADKVEQCKNQEEIINQEAKAAEMYWRGIAEFYPIDGRKKRYDDPDPFNMMLNYAYSVLMSAVTAAIDLTNLDPFAGFLHSENPRRPALVVDLMEEFRQPVADRAVFRVEPEVKNGLLTRRTRKEIILEIQKRLETKVTFGNRKLPIEDHILLQARRVEKFLLGKGKYKPFILR